MASHDPMSVFELEADSDASQEALESVKKSREKNKENKISGKSVETYCYKNQPWPVSDCVSYGNKCSNEEMEVDECGDVKRDEKIISKLLACPTQPLLTQNALSVMEDSRVTHNAIVNDNNAIDYRQTNATNQNSDIDRTKNKLVINSSIAQIKSSDEDQNCDKSLVTHNASSFMADSNFTHVSVVNDAEIKPRKEVTNLTGLQKAKGESSRPGKRRVAYIYSQDLVQMSDLMQKIPERASMVQYLIEAYGLLRYMKVVSPVPASEESVLQFHSADYIMFLQKINNQDDEEIYNEEAAQYGLTYDCPVHQGVYDYARLVGGATVCAAEQLLTGLCDVAINWFGGWHHAQKDSASGFCYINDIVLGILKLREKYSRVLYVDLDLHHGDGVENAFSATSAVMTVSFHKYAAGFFPGSGSITDTGTGKGKFYSVNVPLNDGIRDREYVALFCRVMSKVHEVFRPEAVVCQCGADGIMGDPMESFNLTHMSLTRCVYVLLTWRLPLLLLGGGGYHHTNTARCWTYLTALAVDKKLPEEIPDHKYFMQYGPDYEITVTPGNRKDLNTRDYLKSVYKTVMGNLENIQT